MTTTPETRVVPVNITKEMRNRVLENGGPQALAYALAAWPDLLAAAPAAPAQGPVAWIWELDGRQGLTFDGERTPDYATTTPLYSTPPAPVAASAVAMPAEISRELLGQIVDEVFDGAIEDASVIEDIYRVIARKLAASPSSPNPVADNPAGETIVNAPRVRELEWSEPAKPCGECRYDYVKAQSGLGEYRIEWKGWKDGDVYCYVLNDDLISCEDTLEAAKAAAQSDYERRVLACLEPGQGWRDIASAPKDGTRILAGHEQAVFDARWEDGHGWVDGELGLDGSYVTYPATHWMPLPPPPAAEGSR